MIYSIVKPKYSQDAGGNFRIDWELVCKVEAPTAAEALKKAKSSKIPCPVVMS